MERMNGDNALQLENEEVFSVQIEEKSSSRKCSCNSWFQRLITLDERPNQKQHRPVFIIIMSILHVSIYLLIQINIKWFGQSLESVLLDLFRFFIPCMRPTSDDIRIRNVTCHRSMTREICTYDDVLKRMCWSFAYPHQLWRMMTVNILHLSCLHLISNLSVQLLQGIPLERKYGSGRVAIVYWLSGLGASLSIMGEFRKTFGVGASGSLYGLILFFVVDRLVAIKTNASHRRFIIIQSILLLLPHIVISIPQIIIYQVAHSAHVGGGLVGFLLAVGMFKCPWPWNNDHTICRAIYRRIAYIILILYFAIASIIFFKADAPVVDSILYQSPLFIQFEYEGVE